MMFMVSHIIVIDDLIMYIAFRIHEKSHFDFEQCTRINLTDQAGHYPAVEGFPHRGRSRFNLREEDAHDASPLVPSLDVRFADSCGKGFRQSINAAPTPSINALARNAQDAVKVS